MQRLSLPLPIRFCRTVLSLTVCIGASSLFSTAQADEFSIIPKGDPVYAQLNNLTQPGNANTVASLTRYEAALQTARIILDLQNRGAQTVSRSNWRALKALTISLKPELRQLGINVDATIALAESNLQAPDRVDLSIPTTQRAAFNSSSSNGRTEATATSQGFLLGQSSLADSRAKINSLEIPLTRKLRASTALAAIERSGPDPLNGGMMGRGTSSLGSSNGRTELGSQSSLAYDLGRSLTVRAGTSKVSSGLEENSLLSAPLFGGANSVSAAGGGLDFNLSSGLKLSTEVERLRANNGTQVSRIGGGASLSAFQNRLSMSMSLSRLQPEDDAALPATAAQLGVGLDVSRRLSLSLLYQGLFAATSNNSASRVSGGFSLNF